MKKVCVFFAEGTEECEALLPVDLLRRAGAEVTLAGIGTELFVTSSHGVQVKMDALAKDLDFSAFDAIVLPGGMPGTTRLGESELVAKAAHCAVENGKLSGKFINADNIDGTKRTLKHNAYVYKTSKKRANKVVLKKGDTVVTYGGTYTFKNGKQYYKINNNTEKTYVKASNF